MGQTTFTEQFSSFNLINPIFDPLSQGQGSSSLLDAVGMQYVYATEPKVRLYGKYRSEMFGGLPIFHPLGNENEERRTTSFLHARAGEICNP